MNNYRRLFISKIFDNLEKIKSEVINDAKELNTLVIIEQTNYNRIPANFKKLQ